MRVLIETRQYGDIWGLYVNDYLIGTAKARYDVDFARQQLTSALWGKDVAQMGAKTKVSA